MIVLLPYSMDHLSTMERNFAKLDPENIPFEDSRSYDVTIPKFKLTSLMNMNQLLKDIGLTDVFDQVSIYLRKFQDI